MSLSQSGTADFIKLVKKHPILYDACHKNYKNVYLKNQVWEEIGEKIDLSGEFAKMKWKNLRDTYIKYLKTNQAMMNHGLNTASYIRYGKWQWASAMEFVKHHSLVAINDTPNREGETPSKNKEAESDKDEENTTTSNNCDTGNKKPIYNKRKRSNSTTDTQLPKTLPKSPKIAHGLTSTEHIMIGYAKAIDNFNSERRKILTKMKIAKIIMEAELENEQERSGETQNTVYESDDSLGPSTSKQSRDAKNLQSEYSNYSPATNNSENKDDDTDDPLLDNIKCEIEIDDC